MKNILFSTTRQYNPGDEFILMGLENLFRVLGLQYNAVIANRHPFLDRKSQRTSSDNSFDFVDWDLIDYVVFAGSPAWWQNKGSVSDIISSIGKPCFKNTLARYLQLGGRYVTNEIYMGINKYDKRCAYLGVGIGTKMVQLNKLVLHTFKNNTDMIITRNKRTFDYIPPANKPILLPCPALFAADTAGASYKKIVTDIRNVLFIIQGQEIKRGYDGLSREILEYVVGEYHKVKKTFPDIKIACFSWQDYVKVKSLLPAENYIYEFRSEKWPSILSEFDFVVSTRVHGCGLASSLRIPNIMIKKNLRSTTTELFLSRIVEAGEDILKIMKNTDVAKLSNLLEQHKKNSEKEWIRYMKANLSIL